MASSDKKELCPSPTAAPKVWTIAAQSFMDSFLTTAFLIIMPLALILSDIGLQFYALGCFGIFVTLLVDSWSCLRFFARQSGQGSIGGFLRLVLTMASLWLEINCLIPAVLGFIVCDCYLVGCWLIGGLSRMAYRLEHDVIPN
ncbi:hypothetical protein F5X97DRAFT_220675 [Nemania serpens]|nr:hypothetical protein F5X97DRAFT_220675 [Nemania serpens]